MSTPLASSSPFSAQLKVFVYGDEPDIDAIPHFQELAQAALVAVSGDTTLAVLTSNVVVGGRVHGGGADANAWYVPVSMLVHYTSLRRITEVEMVRALARAFWRTFNFWNDLTPMGTDGSDIVTAYERSDKRYRSVGVARNPDTSLVAVTVVRPDPVPVAVPPPTVSATPRGRVVIADIPDVDSPHVTRVTTTTPPSGPATSTAEVRHRVTGATVSPPAPAATTTTRNNDGTVSTTVVAETPTATVRATTRTAPSTNTATTTATVQAKPAWNPNDPGATIQPGRKPTEASSYVVPVLLVAALGAGVVALMKNRHRLPRLGGARLPR